ncbi:MAG: EAL domain-containing protein [Cyanobacteria bacterium SBLK]|nr:EAL domain-containing protein [Cyanobacteria bacterium SBLK]
MNKILAIEDEPQVLDNILDILELEEYDVISANNGRTGVELALKELPDLIISDVMMPHMNGYEVLQALRSHEATKTTPFIFLTAKSDRADLRQGMKLGADDYLSKPFTPRELLEAIETRLAKRDILAQQYDEKIQAVTRELQEQLYIEPVTGLPNRLTIRDRLSETIEKYRQEIQRGGLLAVVNLQIDRFQSIRRDLGYQQTDMLLKEFANCLRKHFPEQFIAHIDAREFILICPPVQSKRQCVEPICTLQNTLREPFLIQGNPVFLSIGAGIAIYPRDGDNIVDLMVNAETAIGQIEIQNNRHTPYQFYNPLKHRQRPTLNLEAELRGAIAREQLQVYYQPVINTATQTIDVCEALIRWQHPERELLLPRRFLPLAQEVGLLDRIGRYVMERACEQVKYWQQEFKCPLRLAVNLSSGQFEQAGLHDQILQILTQTSLAPEDLELELTENSLERDCLTSKRRLDALHQLGVKIAIDNFGTGYSSLQYLQKFKFDTLKIDRCFIQEIDRNASNGAIVRATIEMAHHLGLKVVAEGVESQEEMSYLQANHCDFIQGFYFSQPLPAEEFGGLLQSGSPFASLDSRSPD